MINCNSHRNDLIKNNSKFLKISNINVFIKFYNFYLFIFLILKKQKKWLKCKKIVNK